MVQLLTLTPLLEQDQYVDATKMRSSTFTLDRSNLFRNFVDLMDQHKALLIQQQQQQGDDDDDGFSVEDFGQFVVDCQLEYYPYVGGAAPRTIIPVSAGKDIVFTANESPPKEPIPFHHELAQTPNPPSYVFFYCREPGETGGQTPIIDSTAVYRFTKEHHQEFLTKLLQHGARYIRTLPADEDDPTTPIGRCYQNAFGVANREELEAKLGAVEGCSWEWLADGTVRVTTEAVPAIRLVADPHALQVFQYTFANSIVAAYLGWQDARNDRFKALAFGNMDQMPHSVLESIAEFMKQHRVLYSWKKGDIMALNNQLVMHSREPFTGTRKVLASIWGRPQKQVLQQEPANGISLGARPAAFYQPMQPSDPLVFGFWKVPKEQCEEVCYNAIRAGYRRLDCACDYGNEPEVGRGIQRAIADGLVTRDALFVTSKLWNTYHHPDHVPLAVRKTLNDLQLEYLDEYLIHFPISMEYVPIDKKYPPEWTNLDGKMVVVPNDMGATWKALEALVDQRLLRTIGVCNFSTQLLRQLLSTCRIRPSTLQIETHPQNTQENLIRFAHDAGMRVTAFSVLGASSYLELNMATQDQLLIDDSTIVQLAQQHHKTPAQILLRWALQRNTLPLCKTSNPQRLEENRNVFDFFLTPNDMKRISLLNRNHRYNDPGKFCEPGMGTFCPIYD